MNQDKRIGIAGCRHTTYDTLSFLYRLGYKPDLLITLNPPQARKWTVSGYERKLRVLAMMNNTPIYYPEAYSLISKGDIGYLKDYKLDLLIVIGWQRLIPEYLLNSLSLGAFGCHGSSELLPKGRGRSSINWCLIEGRERFINHLFKYKAGADDGDIVEACEFELFPWDTIHTAHLKYTAAFCRMLEEHLPSILGGTPRLIRQSGEPTYYPKRTPEDGLIDWSKPADEIYNLIRGVTKPYPGAFYYEGDKKVMVWDGIPWSYKLDYPKAKAGEVVEEFYNGWYVVKCGEGSLLIKEWEIV